MKNRMAGFSLVELMVTLVLISILAAIAYPSYLGQLRKSRRAEAAIALHSLAQAQERFYARFRTYTSIVAGPDLCADSACGLGRRSGSSENGYYALTAIGDATSYLLIATASGPQIEDSDCRSMTVDNVGVKVGTSASGQDSADVCW